MTWIEGVLTVPSAPLQVSVWHGAKSGIRQKYSLTDPLPAGAAAARELCRLYDAAFKSSYLYSHVRRVGWWHYRWRERA